MRHIFQQVLAVVARYRRVRVRVKAIVIVTKKNPPIWWVLFLTALHLPADILAEFTSFAVKPPTSGGGFDFLP